MPVSIFFHDNDFGKLELEKSSSIYNKHHNLTIISRDEMSFDFAKKYFYKVNNVLAPDAVTSLDGILSNVDVNRSGVQFFLRRDIEKILSDDIINEIKFYLKKNGIQYNISDTTVPYEVKEEKRETEVFSRLVMAKKARLVITDRYHGLIFSVITRTPVIVFKSFDTKISSGVKWFKNLDWVYYLSENDVDNIFKIIQYYCNNKEYIVENKTKCKELIINTINNC
jgi:pyruvyl transferase EpsI